MNSASTASSDRIAETLCTPLQHSNDDLLRIVDPRLERFFRYWLQLRDGRLTPDRRDFDPTETPSLLSNFWILKREPGTRRYRFRLAGENVSELLRQRVVNRYIDEVFADAGPQFNAILDSVIATPAVFHLVGAAYWNGQHDVHTERLVLPMADRGVIDTVFGATIFDAAPSAPAVGLRYTGAATQTMIPVDGLCCPTR